jgi:hypothetical protein
MPRNKPTQVAEHNKDKALSDAQQDTLWRFTHRNFNQPNDPPPPTRLQASEMIGICFEWVRLRGEGDSQGASAQALKLAPLVRKWFSDWDITELASRPKRFYARKKKQTSSKTTENRGSQTELPFDNSQGEQGSFQFTDKQEQESTGYTTDGQQGQSDEDTPTGGNSEAKDKQGKQGGANGKKDKNDGQAQGQTEPDSQGGGEGEQESDDSDKNGHSGDGTKANGKANGKNGADASQAAKAQERDEDHQDSESGSGKSGDDGKDCKGVKGSKSAQDQGNESEEQGEEKEEKQGDSGSNDDQKQQKEQKQKEKKKKDPKKLQEGTIPYIVAKIEAGHRNLWLHGPSGTGKSFMTRQVAKLLDMPLTLLSCNAGTSPGHFSGFEFPQPRHSVLTLAIQSEGIILLDEISMLDPQVGAVANAMLANDELGTSMGLVKRHPDCVIIATANTTGTGADRQYIGNNQLDASTLDRFKGGYMHVDYDHEWEKKNYDIEVCEYVWHLRTVINKNNLRRIASTRSIQSGVKDKQYGFEWRKDIVSEWTEDEKQLIGPALNA